MNRADFRIGVRREKPEELVDTLNRIGLCASDAGPCRPDSGENCQRPFDAEGFTRNRSSKSDCNPCTMNCDAARIRLGQRSCGPSTKAPATWRAITPLPMPTPSRRKQQNVEMLFAHIKRILQLDRLPLRVPNATRDEFQFGALHSQMRAQPLILCSDVLKL